MTEQKKAQKMLPRVAVHLGKAEWKFTLAKLFKLLALRKNEQAQFSENVF